MFIFNFTFSFLHAMLSFHLSLNMLYENGCFPPHELLDNLDRHSNENSNHHPSSRMTLQDNDHEYG